MLKISHPVLELYTLKLLKSQVPYLGRKWRSRKEVKNKNVVSISTNYICSYREYENNICHLLELLYSLKR